MSMTGTELRSGMCMMAPDGHPAHMSFEAEKWAVLLADTT
jgi:hypothetical protein